MTIERTDGPVFEDLSHHDRDVVVTALKSGATRREVMGWLLAAGASVASAGSIVTAASQAIAATPKRGGKLRFAWDLHGPSDTLDPILFTSSLDYGRGRVIYNNLTRLQEDLTAAPELAESFES
ncbi:MAG: ABC transporter substrate-binding protein, partial [Pseudomonadota bacterium]